MVNRSKKDAVFLIIEGESKTDNGNLREGFSKLLEQVLGNQNKPRIIMGNGKGQAIDLFLNTLTYQSEKSCLLIDLDGIENQKEDDLKKNDLEKRKSTVFYMIQEMESWFFSQPEIIDQYYGCTVATKYKNKDPKSINSPDQELMEIARKAGHKTRREYHKVRHGLELLLLLDAKKLENDFEDFKKLIEHLK